MMGNSKERPSDWHQEGSSSQGRNCSSPILFPSQEQSEQDEISKNQNVCNGNEEEECFEILDTGQHAGEDIEVKNAADGRQSSRNSFTFTKTPKGKERLSLGRKRPNTEQVVACGDSDHEGCDSEEKQRCPTAQQSEKEMKTEHEEKPNSPVKRESTMRPIQLFRLYNCQHKICRTLEDADTMDLYFAPRGVNCSRYSKVIVRKLENFRQRLYLAQSCLPNRHPCGDPVLPVTHAPRRRPGLRVTRTSVINKNTPEVKRIDESKAPAADGGNHDARSVTSSNEDRSDFAAKVDTPKVGEMAATNRTNKAERQPTIIEVVPDSTEPENIATPPEPPPASALDSPIRVDVNSSKDDVVVMETSSNADGSPERLRRKLVVKRRAVLEESSDEDGSSFTFPKSPAKKAKTESGSVIASSSTSVENSDATTQSDAQTERHECPMCFKMFPLNTIHTHAAGCNGVHEMVTRSSSDPMEKFLDHSSAKDAQPRRNDKTEDSLSPVIKVRTPTKVRELKLLSPSVAVRNLATELSSQSWPGDRVQMFGVNVTLSPRATCAAVTEDHGGRTGRLAASNEEKKEVEEEGGSMGIGASGMVKKWNLRTSASKILDSREVEKKIGKGRETMRNSGSGMDTKGNLAKSRIRRLNSYEVLHELEALEDDEKKDQAGTDDRTGRCKKSSQVKGLIRNLRPNSHQRSGAKAFSEKSACLGDDFIPLQVDDNHSKDENQMDDGTPSKPLPPVIPSVDSSSSSDEDCDQMETVFSDLKQHTTNRESLNDDDDLAALDQLARGYKGRKRKGGKLPASNLGSRCKRKVASEEDSAVELCTFCQKNIPVEIYGEHVDKEIENARALKNTVTSRSSPDEHSFSTRDRRTNAKSRTSRRSKQNKKDICLPDLAQATTDDGRTDDTPESPLKTFKPLNQSMDSTLDYYNQFSFTSDSPENSSRGGRQDQRKWSLRSKRKRHRKRKD